jgi:hypothetical protein
MKRRGLNSEFQFRPLGWFLPRLKRKEPRRGRPSASYSEQRLGCGYGVNAGDITRRRPARSPSSCGGRMLQATCRRTLYSLRRKRRDPPAPRLGRQSCRVLSVSRLKSPTRCATMTCPPQRHPSAYRTRPGSSRPSRAVVLLPQDQA